jgi:hypothetical protein
VVAGVAEEHLVKMEVVVVECPQMRVRMEREASEGTEEQEHLHLGALTTQEEEGGREEMVGMERRLLLENLEMVELVFHGIMGHPYHWEEEEVGALYWLEVLERQLLVEELAAKTQPSLQAEQQTQEEAVEAVDIQPEVVEEMVVQVVRALSPSAS